MDLFVLPLQCGVSKAFTRFDKCLRVCLAPLEVDTVFGPKLVLLGYKNRGGRRRRVGDCQLPISCLQEPALWIAPRRFSPPRLTLEIFHSCLTMKAAVEVDPFSLFQCFTFHLLSKYPSRLHIANLHFHGVANDLWTSPFCRCRESPRLSLILQVPQSVSSIS